jgi:hypothetical protein
MASDHLGHDAGHGGFSRALPKRIRWFEKFSRPLLADLLDTASPGWSEWRS